MKTIRGMPVVEAKLTQTEMKNRLIAGMKKQLVGFSKEEAAGKIRVSLAQRELLLAKQELLAIQGKLKEIIRPLSIFDDGREPNVVHCKGTSRKKCPNCDHKLKIWPGVFTTGKGKMKTYQILHSWLCPHCGWTSRKIEKNIE